MQIIMKKIINHFTKLLKQSEKSLDRSEDPGKDEMSEWHRGFYSAEIRAYKHTINYLKSQSGESHDQI